jgi:hypothetical protein
LAGQYGYSVEDVGEEGKSSETPFKEEQAVHRFHMAEPITAQGVWRPYTLISRLDNGYFKCPPNLRTNKHTRHIVIWMPVLLCAIEYSTKHSGLLPHQIVLSLHAPYSQIEYLVAPHL